MLRDGQRQVAPILDGIRGDHLARYRWAARTLSPRSRVVDVACGVGGSDTQTMWLDFCRTGGSTYDLEAAAGCTIYRRNCTLGTGSNTGAGTIAAY